MIELQHITQEYDTADGKDKFFACKDVNVSIKPGEIFGIIGRSGAGKSTLVRCINLLNRPTSGTVIVDGKDLTKMSDEELRKERRQIGMIFQHFNLLSPVRFSITRCCLWNLPASVSADIRKKVEPLLELVGLTEHANKYPSQLSGGQKQRVGIARAFPLIRRFFLATKRPPRSTGNHPGYFAASQKINQELGLTIVMITHEMDVVKQICHRVVVMNKGQVIEEGSVLDVFRDPKHEVTQAMLGTALAARTIPASMKERFRSSCAAQTLKEDQCTCCALNLCRINTTEPVLSAACHKYDLDFNILLGQVGEV